MNPTSYLREQLMKNQAYRNIVTVLSADLSAALESLPQFRKYQEALQMLASANTLEADVVEKNIEALADFENFLYQRNDDGKTNYQKLQEVLTNNNMYADFMNDFEVVNRYFAMGMYIDELENGVREEELAPQQAKEPDPDILINVRTLEQLNAMPPEERFNTINPLNGKSGDELFSNSEAKELNQKIYGRNYRDSMNTTTARNMFYTWMVNKEDNLYAPSLFSKMATNELIKEFKAEVERECTTDENREKWNGRINGYAAKKLWDYKLPSAEKLSSAKDIELSLHSLLYVYPVTSSIENNNESYEYSERSMNNYKDSYQETQEINIYDSWTKEYNNMSLGARAHNLIAEHAVVVADPQTTPSQKAASKILLETVLAPEFAGKPLNAEKSKDTEKLLDSINASRNDDFEIDGLSEEEYNIILNSSYNDIKNNHRELHKKVVNALSKKLPKLEFMKNEVEPYREELAADEKREQQAEYERTHKDEIERKQLKERNDEILALDLKLKDAAEELEKTGYIHTAEGSIISSKIGLITEDARTSYKNIITDNETTREILTVIKEQFKSLETKFPDVKEHFRNNPVKDIDTLLGKDIIVTKRERQRRKEFDRLLKEKEAYEAQEALKAKEAQEEPQVQEEPVVQEEPIVQEEPQVQEDQKDIEKNEQPHVAEEPAALKDGIRINIGKSELVGASDAMSTRIPIETSVDGKPMRGWFTADSRVPSNESLGKLFDSLAEAHPSMKGITDSLKKADISTIAESQFLSVNDIISDNGKNNAAPEEKKNTVMEHWRGNLLGLGVSDEVLQNAENAPDYGAFMRDLNDGIRPQIKVYRQFTGLDAEGMDAKPGANIDQRNIAMSKVAELAGKPKVIAGAHKATVIANGREIQGTIMDDVRGLGMHDRDTSELEGYGKEVYDNPTVFGDIAAIQAIDHICGNLDRHQGNFQMQFGKVNGETKLIGVVGIDNDFAFSISRPSDKDIMSVDSVAVEEMTVLGEDTARMIEGITRESFTEAMQGCGLSEKEIGAAYFRTRQLKFAIQEGREHYAGRPAGELDKGHLRIVPENEWGAYKLDDLAAAGRNVFRKFNNVSSYVKEHSNEQKYEAIQKGEEELFYKDNFGVEPRKKKQSEGFIHGAFEGVDEVREDKPDPEREAEIDKIAAHGWALSRNDIGALYDMMKTLPPNDAKNSEAPQNVIRSQYEDLKLGICSAYPEFPVKDNPKLAQGMTGHILNKLNFPLLRMKDDQKVGEVRKMIRTNRAALNEHLRRLENDISAERARIEAEERARAQREAEIDEFVKLGWKIPREDVRELFAVADSLPENDPKNEKAPQNRFRTEFEHMKCGMNTSDPDMTITENPHYAELFTRKALGNLKNGLLGIPAKKTYDPLMKKFDTIARELRQPAAEQKKKYDAEKAKKKTVELIAAQGWSLDKQEIGVIYDMANSISQLPPNEHSMSQNNILSMFDNMKKGEHIEYPDFPLKGNDKYAELHTYNLLRNMSNVCNMDGNAEQFKDAAALLQSKQNELSGKAAAQAAEIAEIRAEREWEAVGSNAAEQKFSDNKSRNDEVVQNSWKNDSERVHALAVSDFSALSEKLSLKKKFFGTKNVSLQPLKKMVDELIAGKRLRPGMDPDSPDSYMTLTANDRIDLLNNIRNEAEAIARKPSTAKDEERNENILNIITKCENELNDPYYAERIKMRQGNKHELPKAPENNEHQAENSISSLASERINELQNGHISAIFDDCFDIVKTNTEAKMRNLKERATEQISELIAAKMLEKALTGIDDVKSEDRIALLGDAYEATCGKAPDKQMTPKDMVESMIKNEGAKVRERDDFKQMMNTVDLSRKGLVDLLAHAQDRDLIMNDLANAAKVVNVQEQAKNDRKHIMNEPQREIAAGGEHAIGKF